MEPFNTEVVEITKVAGAIRYQGGSIVAHAEKFSIKS